MVHKAILVLPNQSLVSCAHSTIVYKHRWGVTDRVTEISLVMHQRRLYMIRANFHWGTFKYNTCKSYYYRQKVVCMYYTIAIAAR